VVMVMVVAVAVVGGDLDLMVDDALGHMDGLMVAGDLGTVFILFYSILLFLFLFVSYRLLFAVVHFVLFCVCLLLMLFTCLLFAVVHFVLFVVCLLMLFTCLLFAVVHFVLFVVCLLLMLFTCLLFAVVHFVLFCVCLLLMLFTCLFVDVVLYLDPMIDAQGHMAAAGDLGTILFLIVVCLFYVFIFIETFFRCYSVFCSCFLYFCLFHIGCSFIVVMSRSPDRRSRSAGRKRSTSREQRRFVFQNDLNTHYDSTKFKNILEFTLGVLIQNRKNRSFP